MNHCSLDCFSKFQIFYVDSSILHLDVVNAVLPKFSLYIQAGCQVIPSLSIINLCLCILHAFFAQQFEISCREVDFHDFHVFLGLLRDTPTPFYL